MAGGVLYTVLLDANVLYSSTLTDLFMRFHCAGLYRARWSQEILDEVRRHLVKKFDSEKIDRRLFLMNETVHDGLITGYQSLIDCIDLEPDKNDRHVLAAAVVGHCDAIVTSNLDDFSEQYLAPLNVVAIHPDQFILDQLTLNTAVSIGAVHKMLGDWRGANKFDRLLEILRKSQMFDSVEFIEAFSEVLKDS